MTKPGKDTNMLHYWLLGLAIVLLIAFYALAYILRVMDEDGDKR